MGRKDTPLDAVLDELGAAGVPARVEGGRHWKVKFEVDGEPYLVVVARTTSDHRAALNERARVRRILRRHGR